MKRTDGLAFAAGTPMSIRVSEHYLEYGEPASAKIVIGSLFMLVGMGTGVLFWLHSLTHTGEMSVSAERASSALTAASSSSVTAETVSTPPPMVPTASVVPTVSAPPQPPAATATVAVSPPSPKPRLTPGTHPAARPRPYRLEPAPTKAPGDDLPNSNPYAE